MRCNIETIVLAATIIKGFNALDLSKLELYEGGKLIPIPPECLEEWQFIGLSNSSFVELEYWRGEVKDGKWVSQFPLEFQRLDNQ